MSKNASKNNAGKMPGFPATAARERHLCRLVFFLSLTMLTALLAFFRPDESLFERLRMNLSLQYFRFCAPFIEKLTAAGSDSILLTVLSVCAVLTLYALISVFFERLYHSQDEDTGKAMPALCAMFAVCPAGILLYSTGYLFGKEDAFVLALTLCLMLCLENKLALLFTPLISFLIVAVQQTFVFTYLPLAAIVMLYYFPRSPLYKAIISADFAVMAVTFLSTNTLVRSLSEWSAARVLINLLVGAVIVSPVFIMTFGVWLGAAAKKASSLPVLCLFSPLAAVAALLLFPDRSGRFIAAATVTQMMLLMFFTSSRDKAFSAPLCRLFKRCGEHPYALLALTGIYAALLRISAQYLSYSGAKFIEYYPFK